MKDNLSKGLLLIEKGVKLIEQGRRLVEEDNVPSDEVMPGSSQI